MGRDWTGNHKLDLIAKPEAFLIWKDRATSHLSKDRIDIKKFLLWAEVQPDVLQQADCERGAVAAGVTENMQTLNHTLFDAIKAILDDALMTRARQCDGNGLELWRNFILNGRAPVQKSFPPRPSGISIQNHVERYPTFGKSFQNGSSSEKRSV